MGQLLLSRIGRWKATLARGCFSGCVPSTNWCGRRPNGFRRHLCMTCWASSALLSGRAISRGRHRVACYAFVMRQSPGIYVEIRIRGDIEEVWRQSQRPELHEPWDLRFTSIQYMPRASEAEPQRFNYTTRIGFGLQIVGQGESTGDRKSVV